MGEHSELSQEALGPTYTFLGNWNEQLRRDIQNPGDHDDISELTALQTDVAASILKLRANDPMPAKQVIHYYVEQRDPLSDPMLRSQDVVGDRIAQLAIEDTRLAIDALEPLDPVQAKKLRVKYNKRSRQNTPWYMK